MNFDGKQLKQAILTALADKDMVKILDCVMFKDKCVNDVIKECDIPHTTAYRKIKYLLDQGLLITTRCEFTEEGKKFSLFKSVFKSLNINYEYSSLVVLGEYNIDPAEKLTEKLLSLEQSIKSL
jgi:predicted transcriptional regulator